MVVSGAQSDWIGIKAGVPKGSILGRLLFLIYINDIVKYIGSVIHLFADDTSLYLMVDYPIDAASVLNSDLNKIHFWAKKWLVTFNPSKYGCILFSRKHNKPLHPPLSMNQQQINEVDMHKH